MMPQSPKTSITACRKPSVLLGDFPRESGRKLSIVIPIGSCRVQRRGSSTAGKCESLSVSTNATCGPSLALNGKATKPTKLLLREHTCQASSLSCSNYSWAGQDTWQEWRTPASQKHSFWGELVNVTEML